MAGIQNHQRLGSISNSHAGREFEAAIAEYLSDMGITLLPGFALEIGYDQKKSHKFDLGNRDPAILIECKSYTWTTGGNSPSAKIRSLNEAMLHFAVSPPGYRKMLFVLRHLRGELSLASHYVKTQGHLIGPDVEIWEFDPAERRAFRVR
jgi:hypothetical protein